MKVLHLLEPEPEGSMGGADSHVLNLIAQQASGRRVTPHLFINQNRAVEAAAAAHNVPLFGGPELGASKLASARALAAAMNQVRPDILHSHGYDANFILALAMIFSRRIRATPIVMTAHGWVTAYLEHRLKTALDHACHRLATGIILCAPHQRAQLGRAGRSRMVAVIPNGVAPFRQSADEASPASATAAALRAGGKIVIGCVGRLSREKNVTTALEAFHRSRARGAAVLLIVGAGPERDALVEHARRLGLAGSAIFTGFVSDVGRLYANMDVLLHTSSAETSSRVTLEAMSCGLPVIASAVGGIPDIIENGVQGMLCHAQDVDGFARAIDRLLVSPELRSRFGSAARRRQQERFSIDRMTEAVADFYEKVLEGSRASEVDGATRADGE